MNTQYRTARLDHTAQSVIVKILLRHGMKIRESNDGTLTVENAYMIDGRYESEYIPLPATVQEARNWLGY